MAINIQTLINDYKSGMSLKSLAVKYKMSEKELNATIAKELTYNAPDTYQQYLQDSKNHKQKVDQEYNLAYEKLKSGEYVEALKLGLSATINSFNAPNNPYVNTGVAPCPMRWADIKSIFSLLKSLKNLPKIISNLKNCKSVQQFKNFMTKLAEKLNLAKNKIKDVSKVSKSTNPKTHAQTVQEYSKGKNLIDMTDEELVLYYKKLIPDINREELKCLIDQVHRIKNGEARFLNTDEERKFLLSIENKLIKHQNKSHIQRTSYDEKSGWKKYNYDEVANKPADIPYKKRELSDYQYNQLSGWFNKGKSACLEPVYDDLCTVLDKDVYLYRCVTVRSEASNIAKHKQCDFLNSIREGKIIENNKYTSTCANINNTLDYSTTFGQSYIFKIKVPKGTKVLDMRHWSTKRGRANPLDEIVLEPCSYKVNKIDYTTGIVDCDYIPH